MSARLELTPKRQPALSLLLCWLALTGVACGGGRGSPARIELSSPEVTITTYQDRMAPPQGVAVTYQGTRLVVQAPSSEDAPWLSVDVSDRGGTAVIQVFADVTKVGAGTYKAVLGLATAGGEGIELPLSFNVLEPFRLSTAELDVSMTLDGGSDAPSGVLGVLGAQSRWQISEAPPWLTFGPTTGEGTRDVAVTCNKSVVTVPGVLTTELEVTDRVGGRVVPLLVRCVADSHRLWPARHGVAFSQFPNAAARSADVVIDHNGSAATDWSASSSSGWISVTATGRTGQALHVTANPAGLAPGVHVGEVTIRSPTPTIAHTATIRVGLYVSTAALPDPLVHRFAPETDIADPIRPYLYALGNGQLEAHNMYTASVEKVYPLPIPTPFYSICDVSDDGKYLFIQVLAGFDGSNPLSYVPREIWRVNLDDDRDLPALLFTEQATANGHSNGQFPVRYLSNNGVPLLFNPIGRLHRVDSGEVVTSFRWAWNGTSDDGYEVYAPTLVSIDRRGAHMALTRESGGDINLYRIHASGVGFASVTLETTISVPIASQPEGMLLGSELDRIYVRFGYLERVGTGWAYHAKFRSAQRFLDAGHGVLFGTGEDGVDRIIVGQYNKDGDLLRKLSQPEGTGWRNPFLSADGLVVFATTSDAGDSVTYGFRR